MLIIFLTIHGFSNGQEFSFQLFFEDSLGQRDTLVLGYDQNATDSIDVAFGESNIISTPFDTVFEVRISDYDFTAHGLYMDDPANFQTPIQIKEKDCAGSDFPLISVLNLINANFPVKVYWDHTAFDHPCRQKSFITDWHPGGWFDAVFGGEQGPFHLNSADTASFTHTTHHFITSNSDTLDVLFIVLASIHNTIAVVRNTPERFEIDVYPNPAASLLMIQQGLHHRRIAGVQLFDLSGRAFPVTYKHGIVDMHHVPEGLYLLKLTTGDGLAVTRKVIRSDASQTYR